MFNDSDTKGHVLRYWDDQEKCLMGLNGILIGAAVVTAGAEASAALLTNNIFWSLAAAGVTAAAIKQPTYKLMKMCVKRYGGPEC